MNQCPCMQACAATFSASPAKITSFLTKQKMRLRTFDDGGNTPCRHVPPISKINVHGLPHKRARLYHILGVSTSRPLVLATSALSQHVIHAICRFPYRHVGQLLGVDFDGARRRTQCACRRSSPCSPKSPRGRCRTRRSPPLSRRRSTAYSSARARTARSGRFMPSCRPQAGTRANSGA